MQNGRLNSPGNSGETAVEEGGGILPKVEDPGGRAGTKKAGPKAGLVIRAPRRPEKSEDQRRDCGRDGTVNRSGGATTSTTPANIAAKPRSPTRG